MRDALRLSFVSGYLARMDFRTLPFSLRQLQYLVAVADAGGFRRAAELCHVSQPALSSQVAELESAVGVQVFERDQRRVVVTPQGAALIAHARTMLAEAREAVDAMERFKNPLESSLRIGVIPTVAPYLLPRLVPALRATLPKMQVLWSEEPTARLLQRLEEGSLEAVLIAGAEGLERYASRELAFDPFVLALPRANELCTQTRLDLADLAAERLLLLEDGHCLRDQVLVWCGRTDESSVRATSLHTLLELVGAGLGVTLIPQLAVKAEGHRVDVVLVPLAAPAPGRHLTLVWRPRAPSAIAMEPIVEACQRCIAALSAS